MFSQINNKLRGLAIALTIIGSVASLVSGIVLIVSNEVLIGIISILLGSLLSWTSSFTLYALGDLVEDNATSARYTVKIYDSIKHLTEIMQAELLYSRKVLQLLENNSSAYSSEKVNIEKDI